MAFGDYIAPLNTQLAHLAAGTLESGTNTQLRSDMLSILTGLSNVALGDSANLDAFSRLRVAATGQRFDSVFTNDKLPLLFDEIVAGDGAATHDANLRAVYLSTGGTSSGSAATLRQKFYNPYTPGNSQFIAITGTLNPDDADFTNCVAEIGYGDAANAVGFRYTSTGASVFVRSSISGTAADLTEVAQASWDAPVADVDWTKSQIFLIDFQSLAVGRIRFYMDRGGVLVKVHEITNDNERVGPYWQGASLPVYWSVENTDVANETCRVLAICSTVKSEGGVDLVDLPGFPFSASRAALLTVSTTLLPVLSIQVQTNINSIANRSLVFPESVEVYCDDQPAEFRIVLNGTLTGASFGSVSSNSGVYVDTTASAISGGRTLSTFYAAAGNRGGVQRTDIAGRIPLSVNATTNDILTVAAVRAGGVNANVKAALDWREVR